MKDNAKVSKFKMPSKDKKESYQHDTEIRLNKIKTQITKLERKADETTADIKVRHDQKLSQIRGQYAQSKEKLNNLIESSQEDWHMFRTNLDDAIDVLEETINVMFRRISTQSKE